MTFVRILKSIYKQYNLDFCKVADSLHIDDEIVINWEKGTSVPTEKQLKDFSEAYAIPLKILEESIKENN